MSLGHGANIVRSNLSFYYDMQNTTKSWIGRPTTNLINPITTSIGRYNNPGFSGNAVNTGLTYQGCPIFELTFIPQDSSFISRLASSEGFGALYSHPRLSANTNYLSSIYFRTDHPLVSSSSQGFNNTYSNISGWGANGTSTTRYQEDGWTRLYTQYFTNTNGYSARTINFPNQYGNGTQFTVNTTQTQTIDVSVTVPANGSGIPDFSAFYAIVGANPIISVNGGLTGLTILDHGLNTTNFEKLSWPSNIKTIENLPFTYFFRLSVPSTGGANVNISISSRFIVYTTGLGDAKYWKITFNTAGIVANQVLKTYWCCPMLEQHDTVYPSTFITSTRSNTQALLDITKKNTITANSLVYANDGTFTFDGVDDFISVSSSINAKTILCFVKPTAVSGDYVVYGPSANGSDNWLGINGSRVYALYTQTSDINNRSIAGGTLSSNTWYQIGITIDTNTVKLYLNGSEVSTATESFTIGSWTGSCDIGRRGGIAQRYFSGIINNVQVYSSVLTASEIQQNFNALRGRYGI